MLAVMMTDFLLNKVFFKKVDNASKCVCELVGVNEQTIRRRRVDFHRKGGEFSPFRRGCYPRYQLLEDEAVKKRVVKYIRENAVKKGQHFTAYKFLNFVNTDLLVKGELNQRILNLFLALPF